MVRRLPSEEKKKTIFLLDEPLPGAPRHVGAKFRANVRRTDFAGPILSHIYRPKLKIH